MSVLKWKHRKRSSDSIYDMLHLVRYLFYIAFPYLACFYRYCYTWSGRWPWSSFIKPLLCDFSLNVHWQTGGGAFKHCLAERPPRSMKDSTGRLNKPLRGGELSNTCPDTLSLQSVLASCACTASLCVTLPATWDQLCRSGLWIILLSIGQSLVAPSNRRELIYLLTYFSCIKICPTHHKSLLS